MKIHLLDKVVKKDKLIKKSNWMTSYAVLLLILLIGTMSSPINDIKTAEGWCALMGDITFGGIVPFNDNHTLEFLSSDVVVALNTTNIEEIIHINYEASYLFYNPSDEVELTIFTSIEDYTNCNLTSILVESNGNVVNHNFSEYYFNYFGEIYEYLPTEDNLIFFNSTFDADSYTEIIISYSISIDNPSLYDYLHIAQSSHAHYAWNGTKDSTVQFQVLGNQPSSFTNYTDSLCTVEELDKGVSYSWAWNKYEDSTYHHLVAFTFDHPGEDFLFLILILFAVYMEFYIPVSIIILSIALPLALHLRKKALFKTNYTGYSHLDLLQKNNK